MEEDWTRPDPADDEPHVTMARRGATLLDGRFAVTGRLGQGSTAFALLARGTASAGRVCVLKVAKDPSHNDRLDAEATALAALDHPAIVKLLDPDPFDINRHRALLLSYAGDRHDADRDADPGADTAIRRSRTLASRIGESFDAEITERFGEDLLEAVRHLEDRGVAHRDIKPENLGIAPQGRDDALHLVLFDFSLAGAPLDRLDAGTPGPLRRRRPLHPLLGDLYQDLSEDQAHPGAERPAAREPRPTRQVRSRPGPRRSVGRSRLR